MCTGAVVAVEGNAKGCGEMNDKSCQMVFDCISIALVSGFVGFVILLLVFIAGTVKRDNDKMGNSPAWYTKEAWFVK